MVERNWRVFVTATTGTSRVVAGPKNGKYDYMYINDGDRFVFGWVRGATVGRPEERGESEFFGTIFGSGIFYSN